MAAGLTLGLGALVMVLLVVVFTGTLTRGRARAMFRVLYFVTFLSMVVPVVAVIAIPESPYLEDLMERAPIGLVQAAAPPNLPEPQWLVNVGGVVASSCTEPASTDPSQAPSEPAGAAPESPAGGNASPSAAGVIPPSEGQEAGPAIPADTGGECIQEVSGGLAIPFYMVMLSLLGAGINMTRSVPRVQRDSVMRHLPGDDEGTMETLVKAPAVAFGTTSAASYRDDGQARDAAALRGDAIEQFMYLLSAPFLAIAVYYLLQIAAEEISTPVLVVMAFFTGLKSDRIVEAIRRIGERRIDAADGQSGGSNGANGAPSPESAEPAPAQDAEPAPEEEAGAPGSESDAAPDADAASDADVANVPDPAALPSDAADRDKENRD